MSEHLPSQPTFRVVVSEKLKNTVHAAVIAAGPSRAPQRVGTYHVDRRLWDDVILPALRVGAKACQWAVVVEEHRRGEEQRRREARHAPAPRPTDAGVGGTLAAVRGGR